MQTHGRFNGKFNLGIDFTTHTTRHRLNTVHTIFIHDSGPAPSGEIYFEGRLLFTPSSPLVGTLTIDGTRVSTLSLNDPISKYGSLNINGAYNLSGADLSVKVLSDAKIDHPRLINSFVKGTISFSPLGGNRYSMVLQTSSP